MIRPLVVNLLSTVQLTRLTHAFAAVANLWFIILWSRDVNLEHQMAARIGESPLWIALALASILGVGLSTYGGALNDVFDANRDTTFAPNRPIPSGRISAQAAAIIGFVSLLSALLVAAILDQTVLLMTLFCAAAILFYNAAAKYVPGVGLVTLGVVYASEMLILNFGLRFVWPIMLVVAHAMVVQAAAYRLEQKRPRLTPLTIIGGVIGYIAICVFLLWQSREKGWLWDPAFPWVGIIWPVAAALLFLISSVHKVRFASSPTFAAEKLQRYGSLWIGVYGICWLLGTGLWTGAAILACLVAAAVLWMMVVRDLGAWIEQPIGYRW
ncbi:MAG: UbiA family prenyltransferase [Phycisphaerales bacterium]|nr:UbiA family prenyltransferase [Phycisphaerales bacterium]